MTVLKLSREQLVDDKIQWWKWKEKQQHKLFKKQIKEKVNKQDFMNIFTKRIFGLTKGDFRVEVQKKKFRLYILSLVFEKGSQWTFAHI